ncbi:MAG: hypothetical protein KAQ69_10935 [Spirochaetales bacterium]|nr:hypothetical protein [Spirochaetales bacterium]
MKYLGKKSLSSFLSGILHVSWYVVLVLSIIASVTGAMILFSTPVEDPAASGIAKVNYYMFNELKNDEDWQMIKNLPLAVRFLFLPYFWVVVALLLQIINKSQCLFTNFKNDVVFNKSNVCVIPKICKLLIGFSIITCNFSSLLVSIILLILCGIFKNGTALQEEHDLTV